MRGYSLKVDQMKMKKKIRKVPRLRMKIIMRPRWLKLDMESMLKM